MSSTGCIRWRTRWGFTAVVAAAGLAAAMPSSLGSTTTDDHWQRVIVSGTSGALQQVEHAVRATGGHVTKVLRVVDGVSARVPASSVPTLRSVPGVRSVTPDATGHLLGVDPALGYDVTGDEGSLWDVGNITRARDVWNAGYTGSGVDVALIDSGVAPVQGLTSGNVVDGPDLSFESQTPQLAHLDGYGHGTHMASIIVGRDVADTGQRYADPSTHNFHGIAPDARLVSVKVASNTGATDVSQVIAAIDWVVQHAHDPGFNIRVLNLSYGTDSTQDASIDPLDYAVEQAWHAGIVVVAAAGNDATSRQALADPANDPLVIAVGADDPNNTDTISDDSVASFSQRGTAARHADLIAPGVHVLGLRDPGSRIDQANPGAVVGGRFFRGSGTSQSAAVVSGLSALYLSRYPSATPDQVKRVMMATAETPGSTRYAGAGVPNIKAAIQRGLPSGVQTPTGATGTGSLEASRGSVHVNDGNSDLTGERDIFGHSFDSAAMASAEAAGNTWTGGTWNGNTWTGATWSGNTWTGATWSGNTWTGATWSGNTWTGATWSGATWSGATWS
jgi:serine protease AprX